MLTVGKRSASKGKAGWAKPEKLQKISYKHMGQEKVTGACAYLNFLIES